VGAFVALMAVGGVWTAVATRRPPNVGLHLWWVLLSVGLTWPDGALPVLPLVIAGVLSASARRLALARRRVR
jgi:hypothetical protein